MPTSARAVLTGLSALAAAVATTTVTVHAFDRVESLDPIPAGRSYVYFVKEVASDHSPIAGRTVTMAVQHGAAADASVAPSDAQGHPTGPAGATASELSGADGLAFFILRTSATPGDNEFTWRDATYTGQVVVVGTPVAGATPSARGATSGAQAPKHRRGTGAATVVAVERARGPQAAVPPLAAALLAVLLVWLLAPPVLARRVRALDMAGGLGGGLSPAAPAETA